MVFIVAVLKGKFLSKILLEVHTLQNHKFPIMPKLPMEIQTEPGLNRVFKWQEYGKNLRK
ncbi:MAG: hypothetical protein BGO39_03710 [Chloroflexi bacterium 54-19]|nr:MAG: hypothetical protein BGO39_03710 [Chloroflexi bacterium 54-19]